MTKNSVSSLAKQTVIYGASSILGRLLNYLLVPLYSRLFLPVEAAVYIEFYAYAAIFIVILTYGMETAFFRFINDQNIKDKDRVYSTSFSSILLTSSLFVIILSIFSNGIATSLGYPGNAEYVIFFAIVAGADAVASIPFAYLRSKGKAMTFASIRIINIVVNVFLNILFLVIIPNAYNNHPELQSFLSIFTDGKPWVGYIFVANVVTSLLNLILLFPHYKQVKIKIDKKLWNKMLKYAIPLLILGLSGILNNNIDRILLKNLLPPEIALHQMGVYGMVFKFSVIMSLAIQAFRYAADPFFFEQSKDSDAKGVYAKVMNYFVITLVIIYAFTMLNMDYIKYFVGKAYFEGLTVVNILLLSQLFLGIFYNLSIWYKLTDKTIMGAIVSIIGTTILIILNIILIPKIGYVGSAWANLICNFSIVLISYFLSQKYYPVPYELKKIIVYIITGIIIVYIGSFVPTIDNHFLNILAHNSLILLYIPIIYYLEPTFWLFIKNTFKIKKH
ncbi:MAG: oligosaccharide flippase family protein [Bacteroidales bacterium]